MRIRPSGVRLAPVKGGIRVPLCACIWLLFLAPAGAREPAQDALWIVPEDTLAGVRIPLEALIEAALEHNIRLQISRAQARASQARADVARGAFHPAVDGRGAFTRQDLSNNIETGGFVQDFRTQTYGVGISQTFGAGTHLGLELTATRREATLTEFGRRSDYLTDLSVSLQQPLLEGFRTADVSVVAARHSARAAQNRADRAVAEMIAQVEAAYWILAEAEANERILLKSLAVADTLRFRNAELHKRDLASELDVLTAESGVAIRRAGWVDARRARLDAADALVFVVYGRRAADYLREQTLPVKTAPGMLLTLSLPPVVAAEAQAVAARRDVAAAREELRGAEAVLDAARNALRPLLDFQSRVGTQGNAPGAGAAFKRLNQGLSWSAGLVFSNFLGNRSDRGRYRSARWQYEQQRLALQEVENVARQEVRAAVRAVGAGLERLAQAERAAGFASRQLSAERKRLDLGLGDSFRVLQTEETVAQAELTAVRARFDLARAVMRYRLAMGQLGRPYEK